VLYYSFIIKHICMRNERRGFAPESIRSVAKPEDINKKLDAEVDIEFALLTETLKKYDEVREILKQGLVVARDEYGISKEDIVGRMVGGSEVIFTEDPVSGMTEANLNSKEKIDEYEKNVSGIIDFMHSGLESIVELIVDKNGKKDDWIKELPKEEQDFFNVHDSGESRDVSGGGVTDEPLSFGKLSHGQQLLYFRRLINRGDAAKRMLGRRGLSGTV
jgi:hypothetical protein